MHGVEFKGQISFLKAGLYFADHITTVARRMPVKLPNRSTRLVWKSAAATSAGRATVGDPERVDENIWDPHRDPLLAAPYDQNSLAESENKQQLQTSLGLKEDGRALLFTVVSQLTSQKGLDLLLGALPGIISGRTLALLGSGRILQTRFLAAEAQYPGRVVSGSATTRRCRIR